MRMQEGADERRPTAVLMVMTYDVIQATFAALGALTAFGSADTIRGRDVDLPVWAQLLVAVEFAALTGVFILLASSLSRRQASLRRAQIAVLALHAAVQVLVGLERWWSLVPYDGGMARTWLLGSIFWALLDVAALYALTSAGIRSWFREPGSVPRLLRAPTALWVASTVGVLLLKLAWEIRG